MSNETDDDDDGVLLVPCVLKPHDDGHFNAQGRWRQEGQAKRGTPKWLLAGGGFCCQLPTLLELWVARNHGPWQLSEEEEEELSSSQQEAGLLLNRRLLSLLED